MGKGYSFKCKHCGADYYASQGIGFMFPKVYEERIQDISSGKYGDKLKELFEKTPYAAIDASESVYVCNACNYWEQGTDLTLYTPKDPESFASNEACNKAAEKNREMPYVMPGALKDEYKVERRFYHTCQKCGKRMHKANEDEMRNLPCPKCGTVNELNGFLLWD